MARAAPGCAQQPILMILPPACLVKRGRPSSEYSTALELGPNSAWFLLTRQSTDTLHLLHRRGGEKEVQLHCMATPSRLAAWLQDTPVPRFLWQQLPCPAGACWGSLCKLDQAHAVLIASEPVLLAAGAPPDESVGCRCAGEGEHGRSRSCMPQAWPRPRQACSVAQAESPLENRTALTHSGGRICRPHRRQPRRRQQSWRERRRPWWRGC